MSKKTVATIISSGNNYVIGVKGNQANLCKQIEKIIAENSPLDVDYTLEKNKGRIEERIAMIYPPDGIDKKDLQTIDQKTQGLSNTDTVSDRQRDKRTDRHQNRQTQYYTDTSIIKLEDIQTEA